MITATVNCASTGTMAFTVASDWQPAKGNDDPGIVLFIDECIETRAWNRSSAGCGDLVQVLGDYGNGPDEMIDRKNGLVRAHGVETIKVKYGEIRLVEFTVSRPI